MKTAKQVDQLVADLKGSGIPLSDAAWQTALACIGWPYIFGDRGQYCTPAHRRAAYNSKGAEHPTIKTKCKNFDVSGSCSGCTFYPGGQTRANDCRGFTYWVLLMVYGWKLMGAGCTAQWNNKDNWREQGAVKDGIPQDVIVCLFYRDKKNPKVMAHTGLYYNGETCECSSGVQHFTKINKKWEYWGVPACVQGDIPTPTPPGPEPVKKPTLRRGSTGQYVVECQTDLIKLGYDVGKTGADGIFGKNTESGVKSFQKQHFDADGNKLVVDGVVGQKTWYALDKALSEPNGG